MSDTIRIAREQLERQLEPLATEAAELTERLAVITQTTDQLKAAIKELGGSVKASKPKRATKPCATQDKVMLVCKAVCYEAGQILQSELEDSVKRELKGDFNLSGVKLRIAECLATPTFEVSDDGTVQMTGSTKASEPVADAATSWPVDDLEKVGAEPLK